MSQKAHYAQKAAKRFLRGTPFRTPDEAITAGYKTEDQWAAFMAGEMKRFWSLNGQKARRKVKARYPVKRQRKQRLGAETASFPFPTETIGDKKQDAARLALQKRAEEWGQIGGNARTRLDRQAREAYLLYLDFARHAVAGDFPRWLSQHSGIPHLTCWKRLRAGVALELGLRGGNQTGLLAELADRKNRISSETEER